MVVLCESRSPGSQDFSHRPSLGDASTRREGRVSVEDFAKRPEAMRRDLPSHRLEETRSCFMISVDSQVRQYKRSHQPAPHRPLVISSVPLARGTSVVPLIARLFLGQAAQPLRLSLSGARKRPPRLFVVQASTDSLAKRRRRSDLAGESRHFQLREHRLRQSNSPNLNSKTCQNSASPSPPS